jgi:hypothetical protein
MRFLGKLLEVKKRRINKYNNKQAVKYRLNDITLLRQRKEIVRI